MYFLYKVVFLLQDGALSSDGDAPRRAGPQVLPGEVYLLPPAFLHHMCHAARGKYSFVLFHDVELITPNSRVSATRITIVKNIDFMQPLAMDINLSFNQGTGGVRSHHFLRA